MTNSKKFTMKRALVSSVTALLLCTAMLIGTTFAWFTDTATTEVNRIQAGSLKVELLDKDGASLDGTPLGWIAADGRPQDNILWEPGATYNLEPFKIANRDNLALKYKVVISGIQGNAKLLEAIDFTYTDAAGNAVALDQEGILLPAGATAKTAAEVVGETSLITISGHMKETAGNEYQGQSIEGIAITVYATQYTFESDSNDNQYDKDAALPDIVVTSAEQFRDALGEAADDEIILLAAGIYDFNDAGIALNKNITLRGEEDTVLTNARITTANDIEVTVENIEFTANSYVNLEGASALNMSGCTVEATPDKLTGRSAFVVLGTSERTAPLKLDVQNNSFVVSKGSNASGDTYAAGMFGWRYIADGSVISNNTFGSHSQRLAFIGVKLMNFVDGATVKISNNTVYGTNASWEFFAFDFFQNNSRTNAYTAVLTGNTVDVTNSSGNDIYFASIESNSIPFGPGNAQIQIGNGNTFNGVEVTFAHISIEDLANRYVGINVATNAAGKLIAGTFNKDVTAYIADGYQATASGSLYLVEKSS